MKHHDYTIACAVFLLGAFAGAPAVANDGVAALRGGGLVFEKTDQIQMVSEKLRISPEKIDVDYVFRNTSDDDVTLTVAFPLPRLGLQEDLGGYRGGDLATLSEKRDLNFVRFQTLVDGKAVAAAPIVRVFNPDGKDVTDDLKELGVSFFDQEPVKDPSLGKKLEALGVAEEGRDFNDRNVYWNNWTVDVTYSWQQTFPAGKDIRVHHTYHPVSGGAAVGFCDVSHDVGDVSPEEVGEAWVTEGCPDKAFYTAFRKLIREQKPREQDGWLLSCLPSRTIAYILTTAQTWAGPIGEFELVLDKGKSALLSTCPLPGLELKPQGRLFVAKAVNYVPTRDLEILFIDKPPLD